MAKSILGVFRTAVQDEPLDNIRAVDRWIANLPADDPLGGAAALASLLEVTFAKRPAVSVDGTLALLYLDQLSLPLQAQLQSKYRLPGLSEEARQSLWQARHNLARWLANAYEQTYESVYGQAGNGKFREYLHGIFSRMFHYRSVQALQGLFRYEQWIPARWTSLHAAYKAASEQLVATLPFSLVPNPQPGECFSAEQEYLQFLLLQRINTGNLTVPQIELSLEWLRAMVPSLTFDKAPPQGDGYWALDLAKAEGLCAASPEVRAGNVLFLDIAPLRAQLTALTASMNEQLMRGGDGGGRIEIKERLALAKRLERLLLPNARPQPRRGDRRADQRLALVGSGWTEIPVVMRQTGPRRASEPFKYTYDGAVGPATLRSEEAPKSDLPNVKYSLQSDQRGWQVLDKSESGYRIQSRSRAGAQLQIGALLALLLEGDRRWQIGIVRRLKRRTAEHTELGVEIIAENAQLMTPEPVEGDAGADNVIGIAASPKGRPFQAIYVPPQQRAHTVPVRSLVLPTAEFLPGRLLSLKSEGLTNEVRLAVLIEYTKDWVWATFEVVGEWRENVRI